MKTSSTFKLSKSSKRILASNRYADSVKAAEFKRFAIECEVAEERARMSSPRVDKQSKE
jgi:hypothetical protein